MTHTTYTLTSALTSAPVQAFDSADTSINSGKLPTVYSKLEFTNGCTVLNYGGGKFNNTIEFGNANGFTDLIFDPFNRTSEWNSEIVETVNKSGIDLAILSNVLNVIKEATVRGFVLDVLANTLGENKPLFVTVYEGDRTGDGRQTSRSAWQENRKLKEYTVEVKEHFAHVKTRYNTIIAWNGDGTAIDLKKWLPKR